jgi:hypothetical protein
MADVLLPFCQNKNKKATAGKPSRRTYQHMHMGHDLRQKKFAKQNRFLLKTPFPFLADRIFAGESRKGVFFAVDLSGNFWNAMLCFLV